MACKFPTFEYNGKCVTIDQMGNKSKNANETKDKKNTGGFWLDLLKTLGGIAPGVILATKGRESGVPQWDTAYNTDQNTEGGNNRNLKQEPEGMPTWAWVAIGIGGIGLFIFLIKTLANRKAA